MQGEPGAGVRGLGSPTPPLRPGLVRSPRTFLIRLPIPLAHVVLEENPMEPQAMLHGPIGGQRYPLFRPDQRAKHSLHLHSERGTRGLRLHSSLPHRPQNLRRQPEDSQLCLLSSPRKNAAASCTSSVSTSLSAYTNLAGHHLRSTLDLIATSPVSSYPEEPTSGEDAWADADFSGLGDPETFMCFLEASNYCLGYSDSDGDDYDPSRECFNLEVGGAAPKDQGGAGPSEHLNATPPPNVTPEGHPEAQGAVSAPVGAGWPDLEQLDELEARLEEEHIRL